MDQLSDAQLEAFNTEYVDDARWGPLKARIDQDFPGGAFRFLDVGGGNGKLADRLLSAYPEAEGTVLDNSDLLLSMNVFHPRKTTLLRGAEELASLKQRYDLVLFNWVLHHLVDGTSYRRTRENIRGVLSTASTLLAPNGRLSVYENLYQGWLLPDAPGRIIFGLTSSRLLASVAKRGGANTAGVGVCFLSRRQWHQTFSAAGLEVLREAEPDDYIWPTRLSWRLLLHIKHIRCGHFWMRSVGDPN
jgi:hypothetical protein